MIAMALIFLAVLYLALFIVLGFKATCRMKPAELFVLLLLPLVAACDRGPLVKAALDDEVRRLCAIDGGVKVYEVVELPAEKFNEWGQINFYKPTQGEAALGSGFLFKKEITYYRQGNPEMWRTNIKVIRRLDERVLGESTSYSRRGGDLPSAGHDSSFGCPEDRGDAPLLQKIFQKKISNR